MSLPEVLGSVLSLLLRTLVLSRPASDENEFGPPARDNDKDIAAAFMPRSLAASRK